MGADDYLLQPAHAGESPHPGGAAAAWRHRHPSNEDGGGLADLEVDQPTRTLRRGDEPLTTGEFAVLKDAAAAPAPATLAFDRLMTLARGPRTRGRSAAPSMVQVSRLRLIDPTPRPRATCGPWGFGCVFIPDGKKEVGAAAAHTAGRTFLLVSLLIVVTVSIWAGLFGWPRARTPRAS